MLSLPNVDIIQSRVEDYHPTDGFDTVVSRAFSELNQFLHWTKHLVADNGIWLALKGRYPENELIKTNVNTFVHTYSVPGVLGERCCVVVTAA